MVEKPPYPYELQGVCAGCQEYPVLLFRVYQDDVYCYRCKECILSMPPLPPTGRE